MMLRKSIGTDRVSGLSLGFFQFLIFEYGSNGDRHADLSIFLFSQFEFKVGVSIWAKK